MRPKSDRSGWLDADVQRAENAARKAFDELALRHPTEAPIEAIAYEMGALVRDLPMTGAVGRLARFGDRAIISVSDSVTYEGRRRWTIAHELGHLRLHRNQNQLQLVTDVAIEDHYDQGVEREANVFASEFLMPRKLWSRHVDVARPDLEVVRKLAADYRVSLQAAAIRFVQLCPERCALVFSTRGLIEWFALGPEFGHWIRKGMKLDPYSLAFDYFKDGRTPGRSETISASAWLSGESRYGDVELVEDCVPIPSLAATLSLLWIRPDSGL